MASLWVVNASPIILLSKVGLVDVLQTLGAPVVIPSAAAHEIQRHGPNDPGVQALANAPWINIVIPGAIPATVASFGLGAGESEVISHALASPGSGVIIDDLAARRAAVTLSIPHQGTLALVVAAKRQGLISAARPIVEQLRQHGMYLSSQLVDQVLALIGE